MKYRGLRAFCLAAERCSFKDAAAELCVTASAVSHQIRDLESYLGTKLFDRHPRHIQLTPSGHQFLAAVQPHMRAIDLAARRFCEQTRQQTITIEMPAFFASEMFLPELSCFSSEHRHIDLRIATTNSVNVSVSDADICIALSRHQLDPQRTTRLFPICYQPACSPLMKARLISGGEDEYQSLEDATLLVHQARPDAWLQWFEFIGIDPIRPKQTIVVDSMYALARAAEQSSGVALIPMPVSQQWFDRGALVYLFAPTLRSADYYWMTVSRDTSRDHALNVLCDWIAKNFATKGDVNSSVA